MSRGVVWTLASGLVLTVAAVSPAAELHYDLIEGLRKQGYGDMAVQYLRNLEKSQKVPEDLKDTFDLELGRSLQVASQNSENVDEADRLGLESRTALDKFLKEHPTHEDAAEAFDTYGQLSLDIGNEAMKQAERQKDPARKKTLTDQARVAFEEARPRFAEAAKQYQLKYETVKKAQESEQPTRNKRPKSRLVNELLVAEDNWVFARFNLAMIDYHVAHTYPDLNQPEVKKLLQTADKSLDSIWQGYRGLLPGILAHHWTGRVNEELGLSQKAIDIYDEVMGSEPEEGEEVSPFLQQFYGENFLYRTRLLAKLNKLDDLLEEAEAYLDRNSGRKSDAYYGVMLEVAKVYVARAESLANEDDKKKLLAKVMKSLRDAKAANSTHQDEILRLIRKYSAAAGDGEETIATFDEAVALADAALDQQDYTEATRLFTRAMELKDQEKKKDRLDKIEYLLSVSLLNSGKAAEALASAEKFAREQKESTLAPASAVLAINSAQALYVTAQDKASVEKQLNSIVEYTIQTWPNRAEADDARISLGRLKIVQGDLPGAMAALEKVNNASDRFAQTQSLLGQCHWRLYQGAKASGKLDDAAKQHRTQAQSLLEQALAKATQSTNPQDEPVVADTSLNLGELLLEGGQAEQAVTVLAPLESKIRSASPKTLDGNQMRALIALVRGHIAKKDTVAAKTSGELLLQSGQDIPPVNLVLSGIARQLRDGLKADQALVIEAESKTADEITKAREKMEQTKTALGDFLTQFANRQQLSLAELVSIGDGAAEVGNRELATLTYQRVLKTGETAQKTPQVEQALIRVQASLVGLLRADRKFPEATEEVDKLIQKAPKALDPKIEKARILQGIAEDSADAAKWAEAAKAWGELRVALSRSAKKPPVYYEIVYSTAVCLAGQARSSQAAAQEAEFKKQAVSLLKGTLALAPGLSGPDMVARYNTLIEELK